VSEISAKQVKDLRTKTGVGMMECKAALKETQGNQVQAARLLGITRATLRKRVERFKLKLELIVR